MIMVNDVPGIQRPTRLDGQEWIETALRNVYDNLYYLRDAVTSSAAPASSVTQRAAAKPTVSRQSSDVAPGDVASSTIVGTHDQRITIYAPANLAVGTMFFETDTSLLYIVSNATGVNQWVLVSSGSSSGTSIITNEVPAGAIDGVNQTFSLVSAPAGNTLQLFYNGVLQEPGADYILSGTTITMVLPPLSGGHLRATYVVTSGSLNFSGAEVPAGAVNDANTTFTLAHTPTSGSLQFYIRGVLQEPGADYTLAGSTITTVLPPLTGSYLRAYYQY